LKNGRFSPRATIQEIEEQTSPRSLTRYVQASFLAAALMKKDGLIADAAVAE
jgi:hypothetical protein